MVDKFDLDVTIEDVYEENNHLVVILETRYGKKNLFLDLDDKYDNHLTGQPRYLAKVKEYLSKQYASPVIEKTQVESPYVGQTIRLSEISSGVISGSVKRLVGKLGFNLGDAKVVAEKYPNLMKIRSDLQRGKSLPFSEEINAKLEDYFSGESIGFGTPSDSSSHIPLRDDVGEK